MNQLRNILNDLKNKQYIESYIALVFGISMLVLDVVGNVGQSIINKVILTILTALVYLLILERREYSKLLRQDNIEDITVFHPNRDKIVPIGEHLNRAKREIITFAVQHSALIHQYLGLLERKARTGCKVKILMMAPRDENGEINPNVEELRSHVTYNGLSNQLDSSIESFKKWFEALNISIRQNIEIRCYRQLPKESYLFIDKDESYGYVQVEIYLYGIHVHDMPHYVVTKKESPEFFKTHLDSFEKLWQESKTLLDG